MWNFNDFGNDYCDCGHRIDSHDHAIIVVIELIVMKMTMIMIIEAT